MSAIGTNRKRFAIVPFPPATNTNGPWVWAEITPPISKAYTELNFDPIPGYDYFTFSELELYSGSCPAGMVANTSTSASQTATNPSIMCVPV